MQISLKDAWTDVCEQRKVHRKQSHNAKKTTAVRSWSAERDQDVLGTCGGWAGVVSCLR